MNDKIIELNFTVKLKETVKYEDIPFKLSNAINYFFTLNEELKMFHKENKIKLYCYEMFSDIEKDKIYKANKIYYFKMRFMDLKLAELFYKSVLTLKSCNLFNVIGVTPSKLIIDKKVKFIYNITPAILTINNRNKVFTNSKEDIELLKEHIIKNTVKKFNLLNNSNEKYEDYMHIIKDIKVKNKCGIKFNYKNGIMLGNKFDIEISEDFSSQMLVKVMLGAGILEKNGLSFGYCSYKGV